MFGFLKKTGEKLRLFLKKIYDKNPKIYDLFLTFFISLIAVLGVFAPSVFSKLWFVSIGFGVYSSIMLVVFWASLSNRHEAALKKIDDEIYDILQDEEKKYQELKDEATKEAIEVLEKVEDYSRRVTNFSHSISHEIKYISAGFPPMSESLVPQITNFMQGSLNDLEELLSEQYKTEIRASIHLTVSNTKVKAYFRGTNNKSSRGLINICDLDLTEIESKDNYAYDAIVNRKMAYFAEGDLLHLKNTKKPEEKFYCEYEKFWELFNATIVMPIRIPDYKKMYETDQNIYGMVCIDAKDKLDKWSDKKLCDTIGYHIIADYADSIALLIEKWVKEREIA